MNNEIWIEQYMFLHGACDNCGVLATVTPTTIHLDDHALVRKEICWPCFRDSEAFQNMHPTVQDHIANIFAEAMVRVMRNKRIQTGLHYQMPRPVKVVVHATDGRLHARMYTTEAPDTTDYAPVERMLAGISTQAKTMLDGMKGPYSV